MRLLGREGASRERGRAVWECKKCRERVEGSFDVCWNCGTSRDGAEDPSFRWADDEGAPPEEPQTEVAPVKLGAAATA